MIIEESLRAALKGMVAVTTIVSDRIWDEWFRSETLPAIVFEIDMENPQNDLSGRGGLVLAEANIICRAATRSASRALAEAVRRNGSIEPGSGLAGYSGAFDAMLDDIQTALTPKAEGSSAYWYDTNMSFALSWSEGV
jgi:hypothetical protein